MTTRSTGCERMLTVPDGELFVRERGEGTPILLINGLGSSIDMWGDVEERLAATALTISFDLPGSGRSPTPRTPPSITTLARSASALLETLGHERADVIGFSLGGLVAQQLAHDQPARVRRLVLAGTACGWGSMPPTHLALALLGLPIRYYWEPLYRQTNAMLGAADRRLLRKVPNLTASRLRHPPPLRGYAYQLGAGAMWTSLPWIATVRAPTLVLAGLDDQVVPAANAVQLARHLPESRLQVDPDGGHLFIFDPDGPAIALLDNSSPESLIRGDGRVEGRARRRLRRSGRVRLRRGARRLSAAGFQRRLPPLCAGQRPSRLN